MFDEFKLKELITESMKEGTICISFDEYKIMVSCEYKVAVKDGTDQHKEETFAIYRKRPEDRSDTTRTL